jgi:hypothetical protein
MPRAALRIRWTRAVPRHGPPGGSDESPSHAVGARGRIRVPALGPSLFQVCFMRRAFRSNNRHFCSRHPAICSTPGRIRSTVAAGGTLQRRSWRPVAAEIPRCMSMPWAHLQPLTPALPSAAGDPPRGRKIRRPPRAGRCCQPRTTPRRAVTRTRAPPPAPSAASAARRPRTGSAWTPPRALWRVYYFRIQNQDPDVRLSSLYGNVATSGLPAESARHAQATAARRGWRKRSAPSP